MEGWWRVSSSKGCGPCTNIPFFCAKFTIQSASAKLKESGVGRKRAHFNSLPGVSRVEVGDHQLGEGWILQGPLLCLNPDLESTRPSPALSGSRPWLPRRQCS